MSATEQGAALRSVDSGRAGRWIEPRKQNRGAGRRGRGRGRQQRRSQNAGAKPRDLDEPAHRGRRQRHVRKGCPGTWEILSPPPARAERAARGNEHARGGEKSERRSRSDEAGEPTRRDPAEQRAAPGVGTDRRNDGRDTELANCLNETRADSETGEEHAGRGADHARSPHRHRLAARGAPPHAQGRCRGRRRTEREASTQNDWRTTSSRCSTARSPGRTGRRPCDGSTSRRAMGKQTRPIGIPTFEDKVLQRAVAMVLEAVYEQDVSRLLVRLPAGALSASGAGSPAASLMEDGWRVGAGGRHQEVLRHPGPRNSSGRFLASGYVTA